MSVASLDSQPAVGEKSDLAERLSDFVRQRFDDRNQRIWRARSRRGHPNPVYENRIGHSILTPRACGRP
jgi:hypothetical protein